MLAKVPISHRSELSLPCRDDKGCELDFIITIKLDWAGFLVSLVIIYVIVISPLSVPSCFVKVGSSPPAPSGPFPLISQMGSLVSVGEHVPDTLGYCRGSVGAVTTLRGQL